MVGTPLPEGMTEEDYDTIHAAVVETVRGRWFLDEYARRSRMDEVGEMLAAIGRLEGIVTSQKALAGPAHETSPHMRLFAQRADDIALQLARLVEDLRDSGADPYLCDELEAQTRAIASLPKAAAPEVQALPPLLKSEPEAKPAPIPLQIPAEPPALAAPSELQSASSIEDPQTELKAEAENIPPEAEGDPRLAALAALDSLTLAEKLALFA